MALPHAWLIMPPDIIPDMLPEYVPVIVRPSSDIVAWPSIAIEQEDIIPAKPPFGTVMWNVTLDPLTVPCIEPFPIMFRPVSAKLIMPVMLVPFCVTVQVILSWPALSAEVPDQVPVMLLGVDDETGDSDAGEDEEPPHATANRPASTAKPRYFMLIPTQEGFRNRTDRD
jgi:hypothetical protein